MTATVRHRVLLPFGPRHLNSLIEIFVLRRGLFPNYFGHFSECYYYMRKHEVNQTFRVKFVEFNTRDQNLYTMRRGPKPFLPRDAMCWRSIAFVLCLSVCLSVRHTPTEDHANNTAR